MKLVLAFLAVALSLSAQDWTLERLYTRPHIWGTAPQDLTWAKNTNVLVFRWNAEGHRFMDLYAFHPETKKLARLTDLEGFKDDLLLSSEEKDSRRKLHLMPGAGISSYNLSQDGKRVAFSYKGELFLVPTDASAEPFRLTRSKSPEGSPRFSPDGTRLATSRGGQIFVQDLGNGQLWQVTEAESVGGWEWSPDGTRFVYTRRKGSTRKMPLPNYSGQFVTANQISRSVVGDEPPTYSIHVIDAKGGKPVDVEMGEWKGKGGVSSPKWSQDSAQLAFRVNDAGYKKQQILVADAKTGKSEVVFEETDDRWVYSSQFGWSPDSSALWLLSEQDGFAHLYTVPSAGGETTQVTKGEWSTRPNRFSFDSVHPPQWIGDSLYYHSTEEGTNIRHLYRIKPDGSDKQKLSSRDGLNCGTLSEDGVHIAWQLADLDNPADLYVGDHRVTNRVRAGFRDYNWPETRFVEFPSRWDGQTVSAKILLPPGYNPEAKDGKQWPSVFFIHGAGIATSVLKQWGSYQEMRYVFNSYLANQGYVVMDLDYRGSTGYGRDWRTGVYLHMGGPDLDDVLGAVDYMEGLGNIDLDKLGIWGVSYGGFMTNLAMFISPDTFKAGSGWASVNDWENYNAGYTRQRLNTPAENPEAHRRSSPIYFSSGLKNHLLIIHGMVDNNVLFQDAVQLAEKLIQEGKDFGQAYYPQESHGFVRDETWIDACRRTAEWFDRYLK